MMRVYEIKSSSRNAFEKRIEAAKASTLRLTNAKQILDIEYTDLKLLLSYNPEFFDHCMKVADKVVAQIISSYKEMYADSEYEEDAEYYEMLKDVKTLDAAICSIERRVNLHSTTKIQVLLFRDLMDTIFIIQEIIISG